MKKALALLLTLMFIFSMTACSDKNSYDDTETGTGISAPAPGGGAAGPGETPQPTEKPDKYAHIKGDIKEQVVYDENGVTITAKGFYFDDFLDPALVLDIKNNSGKTLRFKSENVAINGYMLETEMNTQLGDGEHEENAKIDFVDLSVLRQRITTIEDIAFTIDMLEVSSLATAYKTDEIVIKTGLKAEEYPEIKNGQTVFDKGGIKMVYLDMKYEGTFGPELYFYIENNTDEQMHINTREAVLNEKDIDVIFTPVIAPNKRFIERLIIEDKDLKDAKISTLENISAKIKIFNEDTYEDYYEDEEFYIDNLKDTVQN